jgi:hypothetical protein
LEEFLFDRTDKIETVRFGMESRFRYAGKEIPDYPKLIGFQTQMDRSGIEEYLWNIGVPISEYVIQAYVRDALYSQENVIDAIAYRVIPPSIEMEKRSWDQIAAYIIDMMAEWRSVNVEVIDKKSGPLRKSAAELHTAIIELAARLSKSKKECPWLPKQTFITLSQLQHHVSGILEELCYGDVTPEPEYTAISNALDNMLDTFVDIKEMIDQSLDNFRRSNFTLLSKDLRDTETEWRTLQLDIGGIDVWRRIDIPQSYRITELGQIIMALFGWSGEFPQRFTFDYNRVDDLQEKDGTIALDVTLEEIARHSVTSIIVEYGKCWTIRVMMLSRHGAAEDTKPCCLAGGGAAPPEKVEGPLRYNRFLVSLEQDTGSARDTAVSYLGEDFDANAFNLAECNVRMREVLGG